MDAHTAIERPEIGDLVCGIHEDIACIEAQLWKENFVLAYPDEPWVRTTVAVYMGPVPVEELYQHMPKRPGFGPFHKVLYKQMIWLVLGDGSMEVVK